jgi:hypothetical protein
MDKDQNSEQYPEPGSKEPWETPTIEQLEFASAEIFYGIPGGGDLGFYAS